MSGQSEFACIAFYSNRPNKVTDYLLAGNFMFSSDLHREHYLPQLLDMVEIVTMQIMDWL